MFDPETEKRIRELFDRPCWEDPPTILVQVPPDDFDAVEEAWRERFGEAPLHFRTTEVELPPEKVDPHDRRFRETRTQTEPADLVLVDSRYPEWRDLWAAEDFEVREVQP